ncbi:MAG: hypothetical protein ABI462_12700, partial [Ignavibacteria bacterium]
MIKNSAILILRSFSDEEVKQFEDFLNSPFHNKNSKVIQLYASLKNYHPGYDDESITKENLFSALYGNDKYKESLIRNLFSDLNILAEKFLQLIHVNNNYTYDKLLIEELNIRDINEVMGKKLKLFEKKVSSNKSRDQDYYMNKIFLHDMQGFMSTDKTLTESTRPVDIINKIKLFLITVMESYFQLIIEEQRVNIKHNYDFLKFILGYLKDHLKEFKDSPLLLIFYTLWLCFFEKDDEKYFLRSKELIAENFSQLTIVDKKNIYAIIQTYCINKIDSGHSEYNRELLNVLLEMLKHNIVSHKKDLIHLNLYRNVLLLCIKLNEIDVLEKFIKDYISFIREESRETMYAY